MQEIRLIWDAYNKALQHGQAMALATVVHVDGSAYRRPGARMLVLDDGSLTGAISGGCLEGDALQKALLVMAQGQSRLVTYDTNDEDDQTLGIGLGCNGIIQVLMEPLHKGLPTPGMDFLRQTLQSERDTVMVTLFRLADKKAPQGGTCLFFDGDKLQGTSGDTGLDEVLHADMKEALHQKKSIFKEYQSGPGTLTAFIEYITPPISLILFGAGNDAQPLEAMAGVLGWQVTVVDGRANYARADRFSSGCQLLVAPPLAAMEQLTLQHPAAVVLMTHNYNYDKAVLKSLLGRGLAYIGSLGPKKKIDRMLAELRSEGSEISDADLQAIHGPAGLHIGAEKPEEIALSILAEIQAVVAGKSAISLKHLNDVIHPREDTRIRTSEKKLS